MHFLFLLDSVLGECAFIRIYPCILGWPILLTYNCSLWTLKILCISMVLVVISLSFLVYLGALSS